ncbi:hypothetical protein [Tunturiibacter gelidiferens]|uniref:hypothetical protein n=1 Tax=Tunturiibacter gelidiferens TaxID=3069689 RepID=UPI003D9B6F61
MIPAPGYVGVVQLGCRVDSGKCGVSAPSLTFVGNGAPQSVVTSFTPIGTQSTAGMLLIPLLGTIGCAVRRRIKLSKLVGAVLASMFLLAAIGCGPLVAFPYFPPLSMYVMGASGDYSQSVTYQINVDPLTVNQ